MQVRADFSKTAHVAFDAGAFVVSPSGGVARLMLDRIGEEVARATSIVRFEPGAEFSPHVHNGGEEFVVLDGVFSDAYGDFPAGSYVRNPIGSSHTPASKGGCCIFVKLWQMNAAEQVATRLTPDDVAARSNAGQPLYEDEQERVSMQSLAAGEPLTLDWPQGGEILVLEGQLDAQTQGQTYPLAHWSWLRVPSQTGAGSKIALKAESQARVWLKQLKGDRSAEAWAQR